MTKNNQSDFLRALLSMEKTYSNVWDSAHGLFGIVEKQFALKRSGARKLLEKLQDRYNILQIGEETTFDYCDIYMDGLESQLFTTNIKPKNPHFSVRMRNNQTTETHTFQIIHTTNNRKSIYHYTPSQGDSSPLSNENITFFNGIYNSLTGKSPTFLPIPSIQVDFKRVILYSKRRAERINIDYDITIADIKSGTGKKVSLDDLVILESKSLDGPSNRLTKQIEKAGGIHCSHLSKFLLGEQYMHEKSLPKKLKKKYKKIQGIFKKKYIK